MAAQLPLSPNFRKIVLAAFCTLEGVFAIRGQKGGRKVALSRY